MATLFRLPQAHPVDGSGNPYAGAKANFYLTGTSTPTNTYTDSALATPHANPVVADANGRFAAIYLDPDVTYKLTLTDSDDNLIYSEDPVNDALDQDYIGRTIYPQSSAESSAGVTPANYYYLWGDARRYSSLSDGVAVSASHTLILPPNTTYTITSKLTIPSGATIRGHGSNSVIDLGANITALELDGVSNVLLENFRIDGNRATYSTGTNDGISGPANGTGCTNIRIVNVDVVDMGGAGIIFLAQTGSHSSSIEIDGCYVYNCGEHGIICQDYVDNTFIHDCHVEDFGMTTVSSGRPGITTGRNGVRHLVHNNLVICSSTPTGASTHCISIDTAEDVTVAGNVCENHVGYGIEVGGVKYISVTNNVCMDGTRAGIGCGSVATKDNESVCISGNTIFNGGAQGIYVHDASGSSCLQFTITGNMIDTCSQIGISIENTTDANISGNTIIDCGLSGIWVNASDELTITGNHLDGNNSTANAAHRGIFIVNGASENDIVVTDNHVRNSGTANYGFSNSIRRVGPSNEINQIVTLANDATPSVAYGTVFRTGGTTTITDFDDGIAGQEITIHVDHSVTFDCTGTALVTAGGADISASAGDVVRAYTQDSNTWILDYIASS